jgi:transposase
VIATAFTAVVPDPGRFSSGRHLSAWLGLVPGQHSTGGIDRHRRGKLWSWIEDLLARRPFNVVVAAVANKLARIIWVMLSRGEAYRCAA